MKFRVERDVLAEAVAWTARSLPVRPPVPVLAGLLLRAEGSRLSLSGFDYEVSAHVAVDADIVDDGEALVSGRLLADICRSLPARPVEVTVDGSRVVLTCGSSRFTLLTLPVADYPALPTMPEASGTVAGGALAAAVAQVAVAAGRDDTLPVLTGVLIEIDGERVSLIATDRYRLAMRELRWQPARPDASVVALVPARTLSDTAKSLAGDAQVVLALAAGSGEGLMGFEGGGRRTTTRLLEGEFPKVRGIVPAEAAATAQLETAPFVEAVRRVALVAERNNPIRLSFEGSEVVLEAGSGEDAQASEAMPAQFDGEPITVAFNPAYLLDGLGAIDAPVAQLAFTTATRPAVLTGRQADGSPLDDESHNSYLYVLMPIRLAG